MTNDQRDHFSFLCSINELADLLNQSSNIETFLQQAADMVARHLTADVCSIYLYDEASKELVLKKRIGMTAENPGNIRIKPGQGVVGTTFKTLVPIIEGHATSKPDGRLTEQTNGEPFESLLAVPIQQGVQKIGVLTVQHRTPNYFNEKDMMALRISASQLASVMENARLMMNLPQPHSSPSAADHLESQQIIRGDAASSGIVCAKSALFKRSHTDLLLQCPADPEPFYTLDDFHRAVHKTNDQLIEFQTRLAERMIESASLIFAAHFMILKDAKFIGKISQLILQGTSPPNAIRTVVRQYNDIFSASSHEYIREKVNDMEDLAGRILKNLFNWTFEEHDFYKNRIVIAQVLHPSEILRLASEDVKGIILAQGGVTSHVSILSRSLQIPMIIANSPELPMLPEGTPILMDAEVGTIYIRPSEEIVQRFETQKAVRKKMSTLIGDVSPRTLTKDGEPVHLLANINLLSELSLACDLKAEGVGLYRTEFPFLIRSTFPSEEDQYIIYKRLFDKMKGREVTIRTLDVGGEKMPAVADRSDPNPELGLRSIRFSLRHRDLFEQQIRAILRAASESEQVKIMFPMISSLDEFLEAKHVVRDCMVSLEWNRMPYHARPSIGMMVELPSVLEIIRELAREADFFSIGTNDFVQYMLAADRSNDKVAHYYCPHHPAVLRGLAKIVNAAVAEKKEVSICGEMAYQLIYIPFLIGIGIRRFSVDPQFLPILQRTINNLSVLEAQAHAQELLKQSTIEGVSNLLKARHSNLKKGDNEHAIR